MLSSGLSWFSCHPPAEAAENRVIRERSHNGHPRLTTCTRRTLAAVKWGQVMALVGGLPQVVALRINGLDQLKMGLPMQCKPSPSFSSQDLALGRHKLVEALKDKPLGSVRGGRQAIVVTASAVAPPPPPIDDDLHTLIEEMGGEVSDTGVVKTFGNDVEAIKAAGNGVVVAELSHFGRLRVTGDDRIRFLHNQSTADFQSLREGQGCDTVFVTSTARTIDLATAWIMKTAVILFVSPNTRESLLKMLNKYIFFADKVEVEDVTEKTYFLSIHGPKSDELMKQLNLGDIVGEAYGTHKHYAVEGTPVTVGVGNGLSEKGYSLLLSTATAGLVWNLILRAGAVPIGATAWERLRVLHGRPAAGKELVEEFNVLEAGLWKTVSLTKGCYIGQETVTRLITYDGVKQQLWGIQLDGPAEPGSSITMDGKKVGTLTSYTLGNGSDHFGLCYIRKQAGGAGLQVDIAGVNGKVVDVPFLTRSLPS